MYRIIVGEDYNYRAGRDSVSDNRWQQEFNYRSGRDGVSDSHWQQEYNLKASDRL